MQPEAQPKPASQAVPRVSPTAQTPPLIRWLIRIRAYFRKEVNELRRQPLLILSLIGGPLLVLIVFGASYQNSNPRLRTAIIVPPGGVPGITEEQIRSLAGLNFTLEEISEDRAGAEARLRAGELDVVQILPTNIFDAVRRGESPQIEFQSNAINPLVEGWIQYLAYAEVNEINKAILKQQTVSAQTEAANVKLKISDFRIKIGELETGADEIELVSLKQNLNELQEGLAKLQAQLPAEGSIGSEQADVVKLRSELTRIQQNLEEIDQAIEDGTIEERIDEIRTAQEDLLHMEGIIDIFVKLSPDVVVAPVRQTYANVRGSAYPAVVYYAPGVLALLIQHTAITLGALALVRERLMGAFEVFRVAPVNMIQLLAGKYLGYTLFIVLTAGILFGALRLLGVPLLGSLWQFSALLLLLTLASLGIGFLISAISKSDSQAIQLAMITLLLSIFFSGFFIALESFAPAALALSYAIPMTHGVIGFQNLLLRGIAPESWNWWGLALIALLTFALVVVVTRRQFQKA